MRPRFKRFQSFSRDGTFVVQPDIGIELRIDDPEGQVEHLCSLLDGERPVEAVYEAMVRRWPDLALADLLEGLRALGAAGIVDDAEMATTSTARHGGNVAFFGAFDTLDRTRHDMQRRLAGAHVLLLGLGGVGSTLLMNLAGLGVGSVTLVDCDVVELSNLNRQFVYAERDVRASKVQAAAAWLRAFNSEVRVATIARRIAGAGDVAALLDGVDLVLMAIDEPPIEVDRWVNEACVGAGVPYIAGGIRIRRALYFSIWPGVSGCFRCLDLFQGESEAEAGIPAGDGGRAPSIAPAVTLVGGLMAMEATRYLTRFAPPVSAGRIWLADLESGAIDVALEWPRDDACTLCGIGATARGCGGTPSEGWAAGLRQAGS